MLTKQEQEWIKKVQKALDACPGSLKDRALSYTIGDNYITIFDNAKYNDTGKDVCIDVQNSDAELAVFTFPFEVWSTAG